MGNYAIQNHETALKVVRFASVNKPFQIRTLRKRLEGSECDSRKSGLNQNGLRLAAVDQLHRKDAIRKRAPKSRGS
jgi:hypothetical protein